MKDLSSLITENQTIRLTNLTPLVNAASFWLDENWWVIILVIHDDVYFNIIFSYGVVREPCGANNLRQKIKNRIKKN